MLGNCAAREWAICTGRMSRLEEMTEFVIVTTIVFDQANRPDRRFGRI